VLNWIKAIIVFFIGSFCLQVIGLTTTYIGTFVSEMPEATLLNFLCGLIVYVLIAISVMVVYLIKETYFDN
jgi:hypothetical protein